MHETRLMITNNPYNPLCYIVTKVNEMTPQGVIKLSFKQDDYNEQRDNVDLLVCDYYTDTGHTQVEPTTITPSPNPNKTSIIVNMDVDANNELIPNHQVGLMESVNIGVISYYNVKFSDQEIKPEWRIELIDVNNEYSEKDKKYYEGLIKITEFDNETISIKPGKAKSLLDKKFTLSVCEKETGDYYSSCTLEVAP